VIRQNAFIQTCGAFARPMWMQYSKNFIGTGCGTLGAILATHLFIHLPEAITQLKPHDGIEVRFFSMGISILLFLNCYFLAIKIGSGYDSGKDNPGSKMYGTQNFTLPVSTRNLVLAPMAIYIGSVIVFWAAYCLGAILPIGISLPVLLPTLLLALVVAASQASAWMIRTKAGIGCLLMLVALAAPLLAFVAYLTHVPLGIPTAVATGLIVVSVWLSLEFAPLARHSVSSKSIKKNAERWAQKEAKKANAEPLPPLHSPLPTQLWYHTALRHHKFAPVLSAIVCVSLLVWIPLSDLTPMESIHVGRILVVPAVTLFWVCCLPLNVLFGWMSTSITEPQGAIRNGKFVTDSGLDPFIATRPISSLCIVAARLITTFRSTLWACGFVVASSLALLLTPATEGSKQAMLGELLADHISWRGSVLTVLALIGLPLVIWTLQLSLPLERIFGKFLGIGLRAGMIFAAVFGAELYLATMRDFSLSGVLRNVLVPGFVVLTLKLLASAYGLLKLCRQKLIGQSNALKSAAMWFGTATVLTAWVAIALPPGRVPVVDIFLAVSLILPANRILWKILLLDASRHQ